MDMDMSIAAMSVGMHQSQTAQDMGVAVLKMAMDDTTEVTADLLDNIAVDPNLGNNVDIQA